MLNFNCGLWKKDNFDLLLVFMKAFCKNASAEFAEALKEQKCHRKPLTCEPGIHAGGNVYSGCKPVYAAVSGSIEKVINISSYSVYSSRKGVEYMANVIIMRVPKDKLQQEIEAKVVDGWKLRKNNKNIAVLTCRSGLENFIVHIALTVLTLEFLYLVYHWVRANINQKI